jgi:hypothetical protein
MTVFASLRRVSTLSGQVVTLGSHQADRRPDTVLPNEIHSNSRIVSTMIGNGPDVDHKRNWFTPFSRFRTARSTVYRAPIAIVPTARYNFLYSAD